MFTSFIVFNRPLIITQNSKGAQNKSRPNTSGPARDQHFKQTTNSNKQQKRSTVKASPFNGMFNFVSTNTNP